VKSWRGENFVNLKMPVRRNGAGGLVPKGKLGELSSKSGGPTRREERETVKQKKYKKQPL